MIGRKDLGSWLEGAPAHEGYVKGSALGLPPRGSGSVAPFGRRVVSLLIDWAACSLVSATAFQYDAVATLSLFAAMNVVMLTLFGATIGQFLVGVRVRPVSGQSPMLVRALIRTVLMLLVIPAVVWNRDTQPLHDVVAGTAAVRA